MNLPSLLRSKSFRRRGMALVIVIGSLALATMLLLAMFSLTQSEFKSTQSYVAGLSAKQFADSATQIVMAQIQNGQNSEKPAASRTFHATQPGMVRVYDADGGFNAAYKLYSSSQMKVNGPSESAIFTTDTYPPANWDSMPARYVDLNEPVARASLGGAGASPVAVYYPVIDPRAYYSYAGGTQYTRKSPPPLGARTTQVEGFSYEKSTTAIAGAKEVALAGVKTPADADGDPNSLRLPMPVEWIYFLQDGTMGTLNAAFRFVSASDVQPSATNPIVARVAFWTDDETCKININTASEPTYMSPPYYTHFRDRKWAHFPAASFEYQRYPGHPATVALSTVLAPNFRLDPYRPQDDGFGVTDFQSIVDIKNAIYDLAPKVSVGGSQAGTLPFILDDFSQMNGEQGRGVAQNVDNRVAKNERLYASVDEVLFKDLQYTPSTGRAAAEYTIPGKGIVLFDHDTLERSRFFLTAHSRAPEFSIYGLPRVCMWPIADGEQKDNPKRTNFDNAIALCATLQNSSTGSTPTVAKSFIFRRSEPHHSTYDLTGNASGYPGSDGLKRNSKLLDFLVTEMAQLQWPENGISGNYPNFQEKYGPNNVRQLAVQFFDYIRCTNLYDGILARGNDGSTAAGKSGSALYDERDKLAPRRFTYTEQRTTGKATTATGNITQATARNLAKSTGVLPGHGQVTPAVWATNGGVYMGLGRMFTLSEAGFNFICTADGQNDGHAVNFEGNSSGGGTAYRAIPDFDIGPDSNAPPVYEKNSAAYAGYTLPPDATAVWWSNFPPLSPDGYPPTGTLKYGTKTNIPNGQYHPVRHPGYNPQNWNLTLAQDTPLDPNQKRIQGIFQMEFFCAMLGYTGIYPEYAIVLDGNYIGQIKLNGKRIWDTTGDIVVKSGGNVYSGGTDVTHPTGGHAGPTVISGQRGGRPVSGEGIVTMPSDSNWVSGNTSGHNGLTNYGLTSNFLTVPREEPMQLEFPGGEFVVAIYDKHDYQTRQPCQKIRMKFESGPIPAPFLAFNNYPPPEGRGSFSGRMVNYYVTVDSLGRRTYKRSTQGPHYWTFNFSGCLGRLRGSVNPAYSDATAADQPFWLVVPSPLPPGAADDPLRQVLRGRLDSTTVANWNPPGGSTFISQFPDLGSFESDTTRTMVPAVGDYRVCAARYDVPENMWMRHPLWNAANVERKTIHSYTNFWATGESGVDLPPGGDNKLLVAGLNYGDPNRNFYLSGNTPDLPGSNAWARAANAYGDFDKGISNARTGPYVNKPDEGNFFAGFETRYNRTNWFYRSGYFYESANNADDWRSGIYMTPNRIISSPVMFGSLPTGVWDEGKTPSTLAGSGVNLPARPWQTLLFRPYVQSQGAAQGGRQFHPGEAGPRDHFLLDLFFMPVVEPYAISEPLSVAGRVNMNYQIMPFTHIRRATAMHAVMKGEFITAIADGDVFWSTQTRQDLPGQPGNPQFWDEPFNENQSPKKFWHRPINVNETLVQFDEKFNHLAGSASGLFRSASQICEMHLIPEVHGKETEAGQESLGTLEGLTPTSRPLAMRNFWNNHKFTGDNVREHPYSNLYPRLTTRSNTFRVHVRAQVVKKARSTDPAIFDPTKDAVLSEYRGSTLLERFIDPGDTSPERRIPDYADGSSSPLSYPPLDTFYQFRVIETKRFNP